MKYLLAASAFAAILLIAGCKKGADVPPVAEWDQFSDPFFPMNFVYPKAWQVQKDPSRVTVTSSMEAMQKFFDPYSKNPAGSQLMISGERTDSVMTLAAVVEQYKKDLTEQGFEISGEVEVMMEETPAIQISYGGRFDEQTTLRAVRAIAYKDTMKYVIHYGGFNEYFEPYRAVYDSALKSVILPKPRTSNKPVDPSLPTEETDKYSNDVVEFTYPRNFTPAIDKPSKEVEFAMSVKGYRQDCYITLDIRPAKNLTLDKVIEQNSRRFSGASKAVNATVSGGQAKYMNYVPTRGIDGRVYFVVKNDKFYRIILIYASSMKKDFLPAFEKTIASLRLK